MEGMANMNRINNTSASRSRAAAVALSCAAILAACTASDAAGPAMQESPGAAQAARGERVCVQDDLWVVTYESPEPIPGSEGLPGRLLVAGGCAPKPQATPVSEDAAAGEAEQGWKHPAGPRCDGALAWPGARVQEGPYSGSVSVDMQMHGEPTPPPAERHCPDNYGDLPPYGDLDAELALLGQILAEWEARAEAERLEAERLEAERAAAAARPRTPTAATARVRTPSSKDEVDWDHARRHTEGVSGGQEEEYDNRPREWGEVESPFSGGSNDIPPKPEGCGNSYSYDSRFGGWVCPGVTP